MRAPLHSPAIACVALAGAVAALALGSVAAQSTREQPISIDDPRPLARALEVLAERHGRVITYEDPRYVYSGDIRDVTHEVRRDLDRFPPGQAPKVLVPRGGRIDFSYDVSTVSGDPVDWDALLAALADSSAATGRGGRFRVERAGDVYHVIPAEVRDASGRWAPTTSILDADITVPEQALTRVGAVEAVVEAIARATNVRFDVGTCIACGPRAQGPEPTYSFSATHERARDALLRVLRDWRAGSGWLIFEQPLEDWYVLNVTFPRPAPAPPATSLPTPTGVRPECTPVQVTRTDCPRAPRTDTVQDSATRRTLNPGE